MSDIWSTLIKIQDLFEQQFDLTGVEFEEPRMHEFNRLDWINRTWSSNLYRRAHLSIVDARLTKNIWMMHCCIFPHYHNPAPIFGFDVVAGQNKITGFFYDFSPVDNTHPMLEWFKHETSSCHWNKTRSLPEWAESIFSKHIIAASNVSSATEVSQIFEIVANTFSYYLKNVGTTNNTVINSNDAQNKYCTQQKLNPHTPRVMVSLGFNPNDVSTFINEMLFPN